MAEEILTVAGLLLTLAGAWIASRAVILSEDAAIHIGVSRFGSESREKNLNLPMVQNLLGASRSAQRGLLLIVGGTALQIVPVALRLVSA